MDKKELAVTFINEVDELLKKENESPFSMVLHQSKALELSKSIPKDFDETLVYTLYLYLIIKEGIFTNLKLVKEMHYPILLKAFEKTSELLRSGGIVHLSNIEMLFLFNDLKDNPKTILATQLNEFKTFLQVILESKKYVNVPEIASHQKEIATYATNTDIINRSIQVIDKNEFEIGITWKEQRLFWILLSIVLHDKSEKSLLLINRFIDKNTQIKWKRTSIFCVSKILNSHKNEPSIKDIINNIHKQYPREWIDNYVYEGV